MRGLLLLCALALAACAPAPSRFAVPDLETAERIRVPVRSIEVREVSLPTYARSEEIWRETAEGALEADSAVLWADEPVRGVTQELTRYLGQLTRARVAAEPWPFLDPAEARIEVRIDEMLAGADGQFRLSGQFLSASDSGTRDRDGRFSVAAPIEDDGIAAIAAARAQVVREMARQIARGL